MGSMKLSYVLVSDLNDKMKRVVNRAKLGSDGFVLVQSKHVINPAQADAVFSESGTKFTKDVLEEGVKT